LRRQESIRIEHACHRSHRPAHVAIRL